MIKNEITNEKAITLIALIVTIIILIVLAGISISMLTGKNGIIAITNEAAKKTKESSLKEKFDLALNNYKIEKATNSNLTFKEFCENSNSGEFENIKIKDEHPTDDIDFIAEIDGRILVMKNDGSYVLTKSGNLVENGFLEDGNKNFPWGELSEDGLSRTTSEYDLFTTSDFIEVDTNKKYYQSIVAKTNDTNAITYIGISEYDVDRIQISAKHYLSKKDSLTYLEKNLNNGDTQIYLHDLSNFSTNLIKGINTGLIFWNYKDSTGYEYPELTYSRNVFDNLFSDEKDFDFKNNKIILKTPWNNGFIKRGTKVSQKADGDTYNYGLIYRNNMKEKYKYYENYLQNISNKLNDTVCFRPATKYIKILFLINYNKQPNVTTNIKDIIFAECE